jgi:purine-binding chemotaxis protein CheW
MNDVGVKETMVGNSVGELGMQLAGKYLTFMLDDEEYGIEILKVQEIIRLQRITSVPHTPESVRGVINLRGKVIPIIDIRRKFELTPKEDTDLSCIIVVKVAGKDGPVTMGIVIDEVREVVEIEPGDIEETPSFGASVETEFLLGMGKVENRVKMLLDIDRVLSATELDAVSSIN